MAGIVEVLEELEGKLAAAGIAATLDPRALPPMVLIGPPRRTGGDLALSRWEVPIVVAVAPPGDQAALSALLATVEEVVAALSSYNLTADPDQLATAGKELPAYTLAYPVTVPTPYC